MKNKKPFKLNLGALKNNIDKEEKLNETLDASNETKVILNKNIKTDDKINILKKLDLSKMKEKKEAKLDLKNEILNQEKLRTKKIKETKKDLKEVFSNYESEFTKEKETIIQKITKFKNFVKPETRLGFITIIIGITIFGITSLFIIAPKTHNLANYKANLLKIKENIKCQIDKTKCPKKEIVKKIKKEIVQINKKTLKKEIFIIEYKTKIINGKEIIIYKGKEYSNKEFNKKIKEIIKNKKLKKLQEYLKKTKNK